ncbi:probable uridine nucleosidase 2 isoform X2 [Aricia agestis]|uniref:probable uridine nucleosidase 2 isoform X2 n=1 Tax=Aricia agestis TaxID=91739 RepID=UPI001C202BEB|nr:probable uridine nucleosidase 2 isoform X2 [Aricia agestis]
MNQSYRLLIALGPILVVVFVITLIFVLTRPTNDGDRLRLVIDHDGGADDAMAIFMASLKDENFGGPKLTALTTTFGNVEESQAFINSQIILDVAGRSDVMLFRGSTEPFVKGIESDYFFGRDGLGDNGLQSYRPIRAQNVHAALGLIQMASRYREKLIVAAIGALTNIALAIKLDPEFINKVGHLYIGGGNINDEAEFNIAMDPEAYHIVVSHGQPDKLTLVPFTTIYANQNITQDWRINKLGTLPTSIMKRQNAFERVSMANSTYWCLLDPAAMAIVLDEDDIVVEAKYAKATVGTCDSERGVTRYDFESANATARVVTEVKKEPYQDLLLKLFAKDSKRAPWNWKL